MKIETTELIAAAHVFNMARELHKTSWIAFATTNGHDLVKWSPARALWDTENPIASFVPQVVTVLSGVAQQIRNITDTSAQ